MIENSYGLKGRKAETLSFTNCLKELEVFDMILSAMGWMLEKSPLLKASYKFNSRYMIRFGFPDFSFYSLLLLPTGQSKYLSSKLLQTVSL